MSAAVNKVILVGNLGRTPEVRYTPEGSAICNVSLATTITRTNRDTGERKEETEWHRVIFHGKLAEIVGEYAAKGRSMYVEGRLRTRKWTGRDGQDRSSTEVIAAHMQLLGNRPDEYQGGHAADAPDGSDQGGARNVFSEDDKGPFWP